VPAGGFIKLTIPMAIEFLSGNPTEDVEVWIFGTKKEGFTVI